jgi:TRAP-type uncharacterized transport system substrate-binding protein
MALALRQGRALRLAPLLIALALLAAACPEEEEVVVDEPDPDPEVRDIAWATSAVGSAGHAAKVNLMAMLNREMPGYRINVLPTPGAIQTVKGYALEEFQGFYGSDIAFFEYANDVERFEGFQAEAVREPVQSFWAFTMEVGLAIHERDQEQFQEWRDLAGEPVFTGPAPWDTRAHGERAMATLDVGHEYVELDLGVAGSSLDEGTISAFLVYSTGQATTAPWIAEAELVTDVVVLNPSDEEIEMLATEGLDPVEVDPGVFETDVQVDTVHFVPFFYGFHVGLEISEDDVYEMLTVIDAHVDELAEADASYSVLADGMADLQRRGVEASVDDVEVHPGLARWMEEQGVWDDAWNDRIAGQ